MFLRKLAMSCSNKISLEDFQVLAEPFHSGISLLRLDLILDFHGLNLLFLRLLVPGLAIVEIVHELIFIELVLIPQSFNEFALFKRQPLNVLVLLNNQV